MNWASLFVEFIYCTVATGFLALIFRAPYKTIPVSAVAGGFGWVVLSLLGGKLPAYLIATSVLAIFGEVSARLMKKPATLFTHVAVIPLVPGMGLYRTMLYLIDGHTQEGLAVGVETLLEIGMMAMAIGFTSIAFRRAVRKRPGNAR
ncbi:MAG: threonine/serine exporter family protein [Clostridiales bacterium]|jgi:uncharacterized membrane protein YjjB (DUF3815 family)|nr:threonine/serine exporter family protein [Clostridiales bacterium]